MTLSDEKKGFTQGNEAPHFFEKYDVEGNLVVPSNSREEWLEEGKLLSALERFEEAMIAVQQALCLDPSYADAYHTRGNIFFDTEKYDEALNAYQQALRFNPSNADFYNAMGSAFHALRRSEEALEAYQQAIRLDPNHDCAYFNMGHALADLKRFEEAFEAYQQAISMNPNHYTFIKSFDRLFEKLKKTTSLSGKSFVIPNIPEMQQTNVE